MTLRLFSDIKGLWQGDDMDRTVSREASVIELSVRDGSCAELCGTLTVNGTPFTVIDGVVKVHVSALNRHGVSTVAFITGSGVRISCSDIISRNGCWYFPSPSESVTDGEILGLLVRMRDMRRRVDSLSKMCATPVSSVLGI